MKVDNRKIWARIREGFLIMVLCLSTACSTFKDLSLLKSKSSHKEKHIEKSSGQTHLFDYSELTKRDSSFFNAWIWVDGDFSFHQDSGIRGEKALIKYLGKRKSLLQVKDSLISHQDSSHFREESTSQTHFLKTKEKSKWEYSGLLWFVGIILVLGLYYRKYIL
jgi:hypothetical protein